MIKQAGHVWERVATALHFEGYDISRLQKDEHKAEDACRSVFMEWLEGKGRSPKTWGTVVKALDEAELGELAKDLKEMLEINLP